MMRAVILSLVSLALLAAPSLAGDAPKAFRKCKTCHGPIGAGKGKLGPDLIKDRLNFEQFTKQIKNGSKWEGKPPKMEGFEKKKMPPQKKLSDEDIKALFDYIQAAQAAAK
ncbi:MAG: c-type cytochrome [Candidatus Nitrospinota bacterium M3_3B_026]